jgi:shikimate kinase
LHALGKNLFLSLLKIHFTSSLVRFTIWNPLQKHHYSDQQLGHRTSFFMADNILLIGFMGVGKGRTARALAALTGRFAIDTDDLIESMVKMKIRHIFAASQGEAKFRQLEQQTANWLEQHVDHTIVSTGGGFYQVNNLHKIGQVVYLHATIEEILTTMQNHPNAAKKIKKRPLLQDMERAQEIFTKRLPLYRQAADIEVAIHGRLPIDIVTEIASRLQ